MQKQYEIDLENRDQIIASLRRKVTEKDEEVDVKPVFLKINPFDW
jgi:hypothetical protein